MDLKPLFEPKTMAVIGISATNDRHPANVIYAKNKNRYPVEVYGVNPKAAPGTVKPSMQVWRTFRKK